MSFRPRRMLAALPVLLALVIAPAANAHCGLIDASVVSGKAWYGLSDAPPTLLFDIADDEATQRDYANEANGTYYVATKAGMFGWTVTPAWSTYSPGPNPIRAALFCVAGTQIMKAIVNYDPSAPTVDWTSPAADRWLRGAVALQVGGRDDLSGVDHFALNLGPGAVVSSADGTATLDTTGLPDGPRALTATAIDRAGNRSEVATRTVRIDNSAPLVSLDAPAPAALVSGPLTLAASAGDSGSGVAQVRFELRPATGGAWQPLAADGDAPYRIVSPALGCRRRLRGSRGRSGRGRQRGIGAGDRDRDRSDGTRRLARHPRRRRVGHGHADGDRERPRQRRRTRRVPGSRVPAPTRGRPSRASTPHRGRPASPPPTCPMASTRCACWCAIAQATSLRRCVRTTTVRSAVENHASGVTATIAGAGKKAVLLRALALPRRVEGGRTVVVRGKASGVSRGLVTLILQGFHRRRLVQRVRAITLRNGAFRVSLRPRFSGQVRIVFAGDADPPLRDRQRGHRTRASAARRARDRNARGRWLAGQPTCAWTAHPGWRPGSPRLAGPSRARRRVAPVLPQQGSDLASGTERRDRRRLPRQRPAPRQPLPARRAGRRRRLYLSAVSRAMVARPTG